MKSSREHVFFSASAILLLLSLISAGTLAAPSPGDVNTFRPASSSGDTIIPDRWLRTWDPVTVFFADSRGPVESQPELNPDRLVTVEPPHPGTWRWLNAKTLQFKPADPWPAYSGFKVSAGRATVTLQTVLSGPVRSTPAQGDTDVPMLEAVSLTFPGSVPVSALADAVTIALWDAPSADGQPRNVLTADHFSVKRIGEDIPQTEASYLLTLRNPIPESTRVRLSIDLTRPREEAARFHLDFTTARSFCVLAAGAGENWLPFPISGPGADFQPLEIDVNPPVLIVRMSSSPEPVTPAAWWDLVHINPPVEKMEFVIEDRLIKIAGDFRPDTIYTATIRPTALIRDKRGRDLNLQAATAFPFVFRQPEQVLQWDRSDVIVERFGPKMIPLKGRGHHVADVRIYKIDPLDRTLWPFPDMAVTTEPGTMPPFPSDSNYYHDQTSYTNRWEMENTLNTMGSPQVSEIVELPLNPMGVTRTYGLDLEKYLSKMDGQDAPGTYLAGIQALNVTEPRNWIRIQVTDLAVTTVEEPDRLTFIVTSLKTAGPVADARVMLEGYTNNAWTKILSGKTDAMGVYTHTLPSGSDFTNLKRVRVERGTDILVIDTDHPPEVFRDGHWSREGDWLYQVVNYPDQSFRRSTVGHLFTERPVYRPGEPVHIRGWIRNRISGSFSMSEPKVELSIEGPGGLFWTQSLTSSSNGGFYHRFDQKDAPAGLYSVSVLQAGVTITSGSFRMEDYRIPQFEILLHGNDVVPLDAEFSVTLTAKYYAGGVMIDRPVNWRVTQHPASWQAEGLPDFRFAVDDRFTSRPGLRESPVINTALRTDLDGGSSVTINPLEELSLAPRNYMIEATVTGVDGQTVTAVKQIRALPAFLLGIKAARIVEPGSPLSSQIAVLTPEGRLESGREVTVRLIRRTWHTVLKAGNYSAGDLKYDTHIVETPVTTTTVMSADSPADVTFPIDESGVYVVEATARDRLGRAQTVSVDVFVQGPSPVTWERAPERTFILKTGKSVYEPGDTAELLIESPFQTAEAVAVVESPEGLQFNHAAVRNGVCVIRIPVREEWCPEIPVSVLLMRGRLPGNRIEPVAGTDLGKPQTLGASVELRVSNSRYLAVIAVEHPPKAVPGETVNLDISMKDPAGKALSGEAVVWLVDRAVLALGREPGLDPLKDLLIPFNSRIGIRDTREFVTGLLPGIFTPGGGYGDDMSGNIFDRMSLRKKFEPVPFYDPFVSIGPNGKIRLSVTLPDNLTEFAVRVKACSGPQRFGAVESRLAVRLPVVMQPTLPRFLRPGDEFEALGVSRIVEGEAGAGRIAIQAEGLQIAGEAVKTVDWEVNMPVRTEFTLTVPGSETAEEGQPFPESVLIRLAAERLADGVGDAAETSLPVIEGTRDWTMTWIQTLQKGETASIPGIDPAVVNSKSATREIRFSTSSLLVTALEAESMFWDYPYGCTEQRLSTASGILALKAMRETLSLPSDSARYDQAIRNTIDYLPSVMTPDGLVGFWPGQSGTVHLGARALRFLAEARTAGFVVDPLIVEQLTRSLKSSLRSDAKNLVNGVQVEERVMALEALTVTGVAETGYIEEMARQAEGLSPETRARVIRLFAGMDGADPARIKTLADSLWNEIVFESIAGKQVAIGFRSNIRTISAIFMSDGTALAEIIRTMIRLYPTDGRIPAMTEGMVNAIHSGWFNTYNAAAALTVLKELLEKGNLDAPVSNLEFGGRKISVGGDRPLLVLEDTSTGKASIRSLNGPAVTVHAAYRGRPAAAPGDAPVDARGFAVQRRWRQVDKENRPGERMELDKPGADVELKLGTVIEEHVEVVNSEDRQYVVIHVPLAAGMEPMNPELAVSPPEARPEGKISLQPDYMEMRDHYTAWYYNVLPKGTYHFYFRTRASFSGRFTQPGAYACMMYDLDKTGSSPGIHVRIAQTD